MPSKMVYGLFIGIIQNYFNGILHVLDINRKRRNKISNKSWRILDMACFM